MQTLVILGTGGNASDILDIVDAVNALAPTWEVAGFLDDARPVRSRYLDLEILGRVAQAGELSGCVFVNSIGSEKSYRRRPEIVASTAVPLERYATLVHPSAAVSRRARLGRGTYVTACASVGGGVSIGDHVHVGAGCIIGHDVRVDDHSVLAPASVLSGFVHVGRACYVGTNACVRSSIQVGEMALVGMGAVVIRDVPAGMTVVGNPARQLRSSDPGRD
jgi:sugar O-acyltransferase (sialic acid O-acetyltransferase NeuD family)